ncbi:transcription termination factor Rho [Candidatus Woesebacteria bacterium CG_4_10_14_0_2_um_filter_39_14]|uniref:Transcription termination factor Rho n=3 Tax=Candidatus Woeseibacteriota TaxID=1752722 RepID=A0A2M7X9E9_9BACT|nr:MAG: transcription termination factor Rho [Candidatus Woesebacteria bacterium CG06_land_8_20_14_3_00_39_27]PIZ49264.1 MAG: transcription termination factor Rho [Candidatus Woesebacteria bacterium CG_4_10_14_0_2_um_filter_39_14]PJA42782.1 MAG: transcription termination factor Rho [Candidatus Woesebacteria bacterium CG_4_9_14_3_um_filter_39_10]
MTDQSSDVKDLIGSPQDAGELSGGAKEVAVSVPQYPVNRFERNIPDANLPTETVTGVLDIANEGSGLLRPKFSASDRDVYISSSQIRRFNLRLGDKIEGQARRPKENERYWGLLKVEKVNGEDVDKMPVERLNFDDLLAIYPDAQIDLTTDSETLTTRIIDLVSPIGFGQRALIVSPPKAGKTWLVKDILAGIAKNYPEEKDHRSKMSDPKSKIINHKSVHIMAVLIGERPEEVTDIVRKVAEVTDGMGDVASSNFDEPPQDQTRVGELALERAKRLVESGRDVVIVLDSITRMARAYNLALPTSGRTLSGGFDPMALFPAKKFFGAARRIENAGSLTIIGTCLVETGSRMDDLIYEEFKGTGNMELHLTRKLADKRVFPAIDVSRSGTRQEELLYGKETLTRVHTLRRMLEMVSEDERTETLLERLKKTKDNKEFLDSLKTV